MQVLALERRRSQEVLTNVKSAGTWGEIQLGALLDQILTAEQYESNVATKHGTASGSSSPSSFPAAARTSPGRFWLPIDASSRRRTTSGWLKAQDQANARAAEEAAKGLSFE